ncbi:MAG TPA: DUF58 domain-containing protein [Vicinamibacterales bacterium]|nr:DUF58 domain-containing protein [Vicinamibacterales bacterium]
MIRAVPGRTTLAALGVLTGGIPIALLSGVSAVSAARVSLVVVAVLACAAVADYALSIRGWRRAAPVLKRHLPAAFAIGVKRDVLLAIEARGSRTWRCDVHDRVDATVATEGMPVRVGVEGGRRVEAGYVVTPTRRGDVEFAPADVRILSRWGFWELFDRLGPLERRRVFPDFAQVARYAWLAGDRRLQEIGVKTYQLRGQGTDFKQLSEYRVGDAVRHIDWRATLRLDKPIVREFQDERDQRVMLLVDCGRRMRADDRTAAVGATHFDQVLNAVMLLSYVALAQGDAVGAMTFGTPPGGERTVAPRKGTQALAALMAQLYDVQPTLTHSDYVGAARTLLQHQRKRALVIIVTNFRDEDSTELAFALRLLRRRHLVLLASLRERIVGDLMRQPLTDADAAIDVAAAHLYEQARRDAFNRLATRDALMADAEPERLGVELVNRYHAVKRAGLI